jgi:SRSO17 transposase
MSTECNFTPIGRTTGHTGQNGQHFMTNSLWSAQAVLARVRREIAAMPTLAQAGYAGVGRGGSVADALGG